MYAALAEALSAAATDPSIRVAVLQGHETVFSAGNDVGDFAKTPAADSESPALEAMYLARQGLHNLSKVLLTSGFAGYRTGG